MITAKRSGRINVWPEAGIALATAQGYVDVEVSDRLTVWRTVRQACEHMVWNPAGAGSFVLTEGGDRILAEVGDALLLES